MESITVDTNPFLFSNSLILENDFGFKPGHATLDMLLLLTQQHMEALNVRHEIRSSVSTYLVIMIQSDILPYSPNSLPMASKVNSTHG